MSLIFLNPYFLFLLPAAGVPILLHLISRGKPLKLFFPSIRFIKLGKVPSNEKRTLTDILLLIIRVLLLLLLVFFFADPMIKNNNQITGNKNCVVIIDTSISSYHQNYFPNLIEKISAEINKLGNQTNFLVIDSAHQVMGTVKTDKAISVISFINNLKQKNTSPNHRQALQEASKFIGNQKATLIIASLFDIAGFEQINNIEYPEDIEIICLKAEIGNTNINILGAKFGKNNSDDTLARLTAKIANEGSRDFNGEIKLSFNGKLESKKIDLKPNQIGTIVFNSEIKPNSVIDIFLEKADDYSPDNHYYSKSPQKPKVEFLLLKPEKSSSSEALFIEEALKVSDSNMTQIELKVNSPGFFKPNEMKAPQFVMLSGCADQLTNDQLVLLREWHKIGTHLIITPSDDFRKSFSVLSSSGIITQTALSKFGGPNNSIPVFFNNLNEKSPYTNIFLKDGVNDFISIPIHQYIKVKSLKNTEVLISAENDDPLLIINRLGGGICFLFTFALDPVWSDLPLTSTFLPLMRQIINVSLQNNIRKLEDYVAPATLIKTSKDDETYLFNNTQLNIAEKDRGQFLELSNPGVYQLTTQSYIVNNSRKHSRPDLLSAFELKNSLKKSSSSIDSTQANNQHNSSLKNSLLYAIFIFIFLEILLHSETFKPKREVIV